MPTNRGMRDGVMVGAVSPTAVGAEARGDGVTVGEVAFAETGNAGKTRLLSSGFGRVGGGKCAPFTRLTSP